MPNHYGTKKKIPSKNKRGSVPPDYDVILPGMGYTKPTATKQPTRIKPKPKPTSRPGKPAPMPKGPKSPMETGVRSKPRKTNIKSKKK
jgi:hypothetical protein